MTEQINTRYPQFYLTVPNRCPYLPNRFERKVFTQLHGRLAVPINDALTHAGFRRSQNIAYKPACEDCSACVSVRIPIDEFQISKSFRRIVKKNENITAEVVKPLATEEQFSLLKDYLDARHAEGGMASMTILDYAAMVEESSVQTHLVEYRQAVNNSAFDNPKGRLIAVCLTDILADGLSMVYSFYDPELIQNSLGSYIILQHINQVKMLDLPYLYLGYWVEGSPKMAYKARFRPLEGLTPNGWQRLHLDNEAKR